MVRIGQQAGDPHLLPGNRRLMRRAHAGQCKQRRFLPGHTPGKALDRAILLGVVDHPKPIGEALFALGAVDLAAVAFDQKALGTADRIMIDGRVGIAPLRLAHPPGLVPDHRRQGRAGGSDPDQRVTRPLGRCTPSRRNSPSFR